MTVITYTGVMTTSTNAEIVQAMREHGIDHNVFHEALEALGTLIAAAEFAGTEEIAETLRAAYHVVIQLDTADLVIQRELAVAAAEDVPNLDSAFGYPLEQFDAILNTTFPGRKA